MGKQLIVSLEGLKLINLQQVVTARGIDQVLVVDTPTGFAQGGIAGVASASALRSANPSVGFQFAFAGGESAVSLSAPVYSALVASGFSFVNDVGLTSFTDALVVTASSVELSQTGAAIKTTGTGSSTSYQLTSFNGGVTGALAGLAPLFDAVEGGQITTFSLAAAVGTRPTLVSDGGWSAIRTLSNLNGSVKVNLSAAEFQEIARRNGLGTSDASSALIAVTDSNDVLVGPAATPLAASDNAGALQLLTLPLPIAASSNNILNGVVTSTTPTAGLNVVTEPGVTAGATGVASINNYTTSTAATAATQLTVNGFRISGALITQLAGVGKQLGDYRLSGESASGVTGKYLLINEGDVILTAKEFRSLPAEGVVTVRANTVNAATEGAPKDTRLILADTAANISLLLPQLTSQQLASISELRVTASGAGTPLEPVQVSVARLKELDTATSTNSIDTTAGLVSASNVRFAVSGSLAELTASGLISNTGALNGYWAGSTNADGTANLVSQIKCVEVALELQSGDQPVSLADLERLQVLQQSLGAERPLLLQAPGVSLTVEGYQSLLEIGALLPPGRFSIVDTPARIAELLLEGGPLTAVGAIASSDATGVAELNYQQYQKLQGTLPSIFDRGSLLDVQFVVNGTAAQIEQLFAEFGAAINKLNLHDSFSFHITDGGASSTSLAAETAITAAVLDRLDGRIQGAVAVVDTSSNIAGMLEKKIPDVVKEILVSKAAGALDQLTLTVAQFRNLPAYANPADGVVIRDTEINIIRALSYGTLDDRVVGLSVSAQLVNTQLPNDGALTLTAATARALGDRWVQVDGVTGSGPGPVVIRDRGAAIAAYIETASLPNGGAINLKFVEATGQTVVLNFDQSNAYLSLEDQVHVGGGSLLWVTLPYQGAPTNWVQFQPADDVVGGLRVDLQVLADLVSGLATAQAALEKATKDGDKATQDALTKAVSDLTKSITDGNTALGTQIGGV
ncbi:MAG: hypothetical protein RLZZ54_2190, partial [Cyanobacteriota bacterium]